MTVSASTTPPVTFDFDEWAGVYGEFADTDPSVAATWFAMASSVCQNAVCNPIWNFDCNGTILQVALYLLTAHIGKLFGLNSSTGQPYTDAVGRVSDATEGSVSVSLDMGDLANQGPNAAWFMQTKYGAMYWTLSAPARTARYLARPTIVVNGVYPAYPFR
jgi:Protein of unknown function (DUF4054)